MKKKKQLLGTDGNPYSILLLINLHLICVILFRGNGFEQEIIVDIFKTKFFFRIYSFSFIFTDVLYTVLYLL